MSVQASRTHVSSFANMPDWAWTRNPTHWMTQQEPEEAFQTITWTKIVRREPNAENEQNQPRPAKRQPQDSNQRRLVQRVVSLPRRLRRAYLTQVSGRSARPQFITTTGVHTNARSSVHIMFICLVHEQPQLCVCVCCCCSPNRAAAIETDKSLDS